MRWNTRSFFLQLLLAVVVLGQIVDGAKSPEKTTLKDDDNTSETTCQTGEPIVGSVYSPGGTLLDEVVVKMFRGTPLFPIMSFFPAFVKLWRKGTERFLLLGARPTRVYGDDGAIAAADGEGDESQVVIVLAEPDAKLEYLNEEREEPFFWDGPKQIGKELTKKMSNFMGLFALPITTASAAAPPWNGVEKHSLHPRFPLKAFSAWPQRGVWPFHEHKLQNWGAGRGGGGNLVKMAADQYETEGSQALASEIDTVRVLAPKSGMTDLKRENNKPTTPTPDLESYREAVISELTHLKKIENQVKSLYSPAAASASTKKHDDEDDVMPFKLIYPLSDRAPVHKIKRQDVETTLNDDNIRELLYQMTKRHWTDKATQDEMMEKYLSFYNESGYANDDMPLQEPAKRQATLPNLTKEDIAKMIAIATNARAACASRTPDSSATTDWSNMYIERMDPQRMDQQEKEMLEYATRMQKAQRYNAEANALLDAILAAEKLPKHNERKWTAGDVMVQNPAQNLHAEQFIRHSEMEQLGPPTQQPQAAAFTQQKQSMDDVDAFQVDKQRQGSTFKQHDSAQPQVYRLILRTPGHQGVAENPQLQQVMMSPLADQWVQPNAQKQIFPQRQMTEQSHPQHHHYHHHHLQQQQLHIVKPFVNQQNLRMQPQRQLAAQPMEAFQWKQQNQQQQSFTQQEPLRTQQQLRFKPIPKQMASQDSRQQQLTQEKQIPILADQSPYVQRQMSDQQQQQQLIMTEQQRQIKLPQNVQPMEDTHQGGQQLPQLLLEQQQQQQPQRTISTVPATTTNMQAEQMQRPKIPLRTIDMGGLAYEFNEPPPSLRWPSPGEPPQQQNTRITSQLHNITPKQQLQLQMSGGDPAGVAAAAADDEEALVGAGPQNPDNARFLRPGFLHGVNVGKTLGKLPNLFGGKKGYNHKSHVVNYYNGRGGYGGGLGVINRYGGYGGYGGYRTAEGDQQIETMLRQQGAFPNYFHMTEDEDDDNTNSPNPALEKIAKTTSESFSNAAKGSSFNANKSGPEKDDQSENILPAKQHQLHTNGNDDATLASVGTATNNNTSVLDSSQQYINPDPEVARILFAFSDFLLEPYMGLKDTAERDDDPWHRCAIYYNNDARQRPVTSLYDRSKRHDKQLANSMISSLLQRNNLPDEKTTKFLKGLLKIRTNFEKTFPKLYKMLADQQRRLNLTNIYIKPPVLASSEGVLLGQGQVSATKDLEEVPESTEKNLQLLDDKSTDYFAFGDDHHDGN